MSKSKYITLQQALKNYSDEEKSNMYDYFQKLPKSTKKQREDGIHIIKQYVKGISSKKAGMILDYNIYSSLIN